ncbi:phosphoglycerol transferase MdoB-like AlkP superfamily enzyme [Chitinophaga skermanii]|uniref:Phosphoglycerol transferase MdoB-like AlkP superfamily enzyme n=1 Tax=Chitinophaga skermanii TaxID=331697 RepID=A0A327QI39_9BACT|nr:LTA synthase family protein [Chitinophaga skermanii]RAJ04229.1 phosphoglycerol transferase MdoB-like AlkP superfamily enzyme [Chitinophaga skermanii]
MHSTYFKRRFSPIAVLVILIVAISFCTRIALLFHPATETAGIPFGSLLTAFGWGLFYDLCMASFAMIPFVLHLWGPNNTVYQKPYKYFAYAVFLVALGIFTFTQLVPDDFNEDLHKAAIIYTAVRFGIFILLSLMNDDFRRKWRTYVLYFDFILVIFLLLFNSVSEWFFWTEFASRYNFIAVDYLIYTTEVLGNIRESYPLVPIIGVLLAATGLVFWIIRPYIKPAFEGPSTILGRSLIAFGLLLFPLFNFLLVKDDWHKRSLYHFANEIGGNGVYEFGAAFNNNELDFYRYYPTLNDTTAFKILRTSLESPNAQFTSDNLFDISRKITYNEPTKNYNVVLISVESFSADFMATFGNKNNITPKLDSIAQHSLLFTNLYATGTRTVRGLEALSMAITPTPGQSIVKRPNNANMFTIGSVLKEKGYTTQYIYGGDAYFDNMRTYFGGNGYQVIDKNEISAANIHFSNIWGVADEDIFTKALDVLDANAQLKKPFFSQIMTVSNHRPFTYPEGRIDIPPSTQSRDGAVKYTDFAIVDFIQRAKSHNWFNNTIFVIVSDHCAGVAGQTEIPINDYHIPCIIYAPGIIEPAKMDRLMSQIDIAPTILGLLKLPYTSKFFGQDIFTLPAGKERAFVSTYQSLGYVRDSVMTIISPIRNKRQFLPNFETGDATPVGTMNDSLTNQAIAYYQCAAWLFKHQGLNAIKQ